MISISASAATDSRMNNFGNHWINNNISESVDHVTGVTEMNRKESCRRTKLLICVRDIMRSNIDLRTGYNEFPWFFSVLLD